MSYTKLKKSRLIKHHLHRQVGRHIEHQVNRLTKSEYARILILRTIGNFMLFSSLFMIGKTFYEPLKQEVRYFINQRVQKQYVVIDSLSFDQFKIEDNTQQKGLLAKALNIKPVEALVPEDPNFSIVIPKIGANARVLSNINAAEQKDYLDALKNGVAHTAGTAFPGEGGHIFLFAHSTDYFWNVSTYNAIFYLIHKLAPGDEIDLFYQGQRYVYRVIGSEVVDPSEVQYLTRKTNKEFLTLQTCWPPGTTLKRLLIFAIRVAE